MQNKFLDLLGLTNFLDKCKQTFASIFHTHTVEEITDLENNVFTVDGGAKATLSDIFGEAPYTIEFTDEYETPILANEIEYNNGVSGLTSTDVQGAIDELKNIATTAESGSDYSTFRMRNVAIMSELPTTMNDGDIVLLYKEGQ